MSCPTRGRWDSINTWNSADNEINLDCVVDQPERYRPIVRQPVRPPHDIMRCIWTAALGSADVRLIR